MDDQGKDTSAGAPHGRHADALDAFASEDLAVALLSSDAPTDELHAFMASYADDLKRTLEAVGAVQDGLRGDPAELRARLLELQDRLISLHKADEALAARIR